MNCTENIYLNLAITISSFVCFSKSEVFFFFFSVLQFIFIQSNFTYSYKCSLIIFLHDTTQLLSYDTTQLLSSGNTPSFLCKAFPLDSIREQSLRKLGIDHCGSDERSWKGLAGSTTYGGLLQDIMQRNCEISKLLMSTLCHLKNKMVDEYGKYLETFEKLCDTFKKMTNEV